MSLSSLLTMLLGAALVAIGVLASALADRVRGLRISREGQPRERASRAPVPPAVAEAAELPRATPAPARTPRAQPRPAAAPEGGEEVIAALVGSGYKRPIATEAAWACTAAERATVEIWAVAALRRARGGLS